MKRLFFRFAIVAAAGAVLVALGLAITWVSLAPGLPDVEGLREIRLQTPLQVLTRDGRLIAVFGEKRRLPVPLERVPPLLKAAFIAGEDDRFYIHPGIDYQGLLRAAWQLLRTGEKSQGGSTITMQLARNFYLGTEKKYARKLREIMLAIKIERLLDKDEILGLYLNKIYLGQRAYGVAAAAQVYYGRELDALTLPEMAMLAALPKAPSRINPITNPERAIQRRNYVLRRLFEEGYIDEALLAQARNAPDHAFYHGPEIAVEAGYIAEMARREAVERYGEAVYESGYRVVTTLDSRLQHAAGEALRQGLLAYDQRHGYRGPEAHIDLGTDSTPADWAAALAGFQPVGPLLPALVTAVEPDLALCYLAGGQSVALDLAALVWARPYLGVDELGPEPAAAGEVLAPGDVIRLIRSARGEWQFAQVPEVQGALVALDPASGEVRALVGGFDFAANKFNRAVQARRQPGSGFKPFIYAAALDHGYTPASVVNDAPIVFQDRTLEGAWKPQNFTQSFYGPTRLREAMTHSRNLVSVRLLQDIGVAAARDYLPRFGFNRDELPANLSLALGSASLSPLAVAQGYAVFANGGYAVPSSWLERIEGSKGEVLWEAPLTQSCEQCPPAGASAPPDHPTKLAPRLATTGGAPETGSPEDGEPELAGPPLPRFAPRVLDPATAYLIRSMMRDVIRRGTGRGALVLGRGDLAGKTGTTNDQRDAWFTGYNQHLVASVWIGFDDHRPLGRRELGGIAALPVWIDFMRQALAGVAEQPEIVPPGIARVWIDPQSGEPVPPDHPGALREVMRAADAARLKEANTGRKPADTIADPYDIF